MRLAHLSAVHKDKSMTRRRLPPERHQHSRRPSPSPPPPPATLHVSRNRRRAWRVGGRVFAGSRPRTYSAGAPPERDLTSLCLLLNGTEQKEVCVSICVGKNQSTFQWSSKEVRKKKEVLTRTCCHTLHGASASCPGFHLWTLAY